MLKKRWTFVFLGIFLMASGLNAQNSNYKEKYFTPNSAKFEQFVNEAFGSRAEDLIFENSVRYLIFKDFFTRRLTIVDRNPDIALPDWFQQTAQLGTFDYVTPPHYTNANLDPEAFNPFYYKIDYTKTKLQYIQISGTHYYMKVKPFDMDRINQMRQQ